eukprot:1289094-Pleurochrysis_carterae.AAC.2
MTTTGNYVHSPREPGGVRHHNLHATSVGRPQGPIEPEQGHTAESRYMDEMWRAGEAHVVDA